MEGGAAERCSVEVSCGNGGLHDAPMPTSVLLKSEFQHLQSSLSRVLHNILVGWPNNPCRVVLPLPGTCYMTLSETSDLSGSVSLSVEWG